MKKIQYIKEKEENEKEKNPEEFIFVLKRNIY